MFSTSVSSPMDPQQIIVRRGQLPAITGLSLATIDRLRLAGDFPEARQLSVQAIGFQREAIEAWIASRPLVKH